MDMDRLIILGIGGLLLYLMIFKTEKWKEINEEGWKNVNKTGKVVGGATKFGLGLFKLFKK